MVPQVPIDDANEEEPINKEPSHEGFRFGTVHGMLIGWKTEISSMETWITGELNLNLSETRKSIINK